MCDLTAGRRGGKITQIITQCSIVATGCVISPRPQTFEHKLVWQPERFFWWPGAACHRLSFLRDLHSNLAAIAAISSHNVATMSRAPGGPRRPTH
jgi:hypothetical protein